MKQNLQKQKINNTFAKTTIKKKMATAIREIPTLTGQTAIDFVKEADKYAKRPVPRLSQQREIELQKIKEAHKHFVW